MGKEHPEKQMSADKTQIPGAQSSEPPESVEKAPPKEEPKQSPAQEEQEGQEVGEQPKSQAEQLLSEPILVPRNPMALVTRVMIMVLSLDFGLVVIALLLSALSFNFGRVFVILIGFLVLIKMVVLLTIMMRTASVWSTETYYITERQLIHRKGIVNIDEHVYELDNIRHVRLFQDFLGRQFDFGHIELLVATAGLTETIRLTDLKSPEHYEKVFQNYIG